jgi:Na+-transporting methylmalonyl-CoA/oxaloacetate decarboxylase gamma subunit
MENELLLVLLITVVGMAVVFAIIVLLAILMAVLVRFTRTPETQPKPVQDDLKLRAAVAAVAVLRARDSALAPLHFPLPPRVIVSAWQAVLRSNIINRRGSVR